MCNGAEWLSWSQLKQGEAGAGVRRKRGSHSLRSASFEEEADSIAISFSGHLLQMIVRRVLPCLRQASSGTARRHVSTKYGRVQRRYSSTSSGPALPAAPVQSSAAPIASITNELDKLSPRFDVPADSIEILKTPAEFYEILKAWDHHRSLVVHFLTW